VISHHLLLQTISWIAISLGVLTALVIAADERSRPQGMPIMNVVWPVTGFYFPVIGGWLYRAIGRPPLTHAHDAAAQDARWKSVLLSATHCGAGCVIGDIVAVALFGPSFAIEFAFAYLFGIAFQYLPIRAMRDISPATALWEAIKADTLSLVAFEVGMFGWMAVARLWLLPGEPAPTSIAFWFMMQIGMIVGFATTYPANWLLVKWGVKSGM
jgi:preprotein translocase subunit SecF